MRQHSLTPPRRTETDQAGYRYQSERAENRSFVLNESVLNDSVLNDSVLNDSVLNDSVLNDSVLNEAVFGELASHDGWSAIRRRPPSPPGGPRIHPNA